MARFAFPRFFGNTVSVAAGTAAGTATAAALAPVLQEEVNTVWNAFPNRPVSPGSLASGVAQGQVDPAKAKAEARLSGFSGDAFDTMVNIANTGPPLGEAMQAYRRGLLSDTEFKTALHRAGIELQWFAALSGLHDVLLTPAELANARQQGFLTDDQARAEALLQGVTASRADVQFDLAGLPPGAAEAASLYNRGLIDSDGFAQMIREGHTKSKYVDVLDRARVAVLTATEAAAARLRTWITADESYAIGAQTGHSREQMDLLFLNRGRPASPTQMWKGWARKSTSPSGSGVVTYDDHAKAIAISDIRPEYAEMLWQNRFNYPPLFQLNRLVASHAITPETAAEWAAFNLEAPDVIAALLDFWKRPSASAKEATAANLRAEYEGLFIDRATLVDALVQLGYQQADADTLADLGDAGRVKTYRDRVVTAIYKAYLAHQLTEAQARVALGDDGIDPAAIASLLELWTREQTLTRHELTQAQIVAAYKRAVLPFQTALTELAGRGLSDADARVLLGIASTPLTDAEVKAGYIGGTLSLADTRAALAQSGHAAAVIDQLIASWGAPPAPTP